MSCELTEKHLAIPRAVACKWGRTQEEIEEAEGYGGLALVYAARNWDPDKSPEKVPAPWLYYCVESAVRRRLLYWRRKWLYFRSLDESFAGSRGQPQSLKDILVDRKAPRGDRQAEAKELAAALLGRLRKADREIVERHLFGREDKAAIGRSLGMTREAVRLRYISALKTMRMKAASSKSLLHLRDWSHNPLRAWVAANPKQAADQRDHSIRRAQRRSIQLIHRRRAGTGHPNLPLGDGRVVAWLERHGEATVAVLAQALGMRPAYVYTILSRLGKGGLVTRERRPSPRGNRGGEGYYRLREDAEHAAG